MKKYYVADFYCPCGFLDTSYGDESLEEVRAFYNQTIAYYDCRYRKAVLREVISNEIIAYWEDDEMKCKDCMYYNGFFCNWSIA